MQDGEPQVYTALATLQNGHVQRQWQRLQFFFIYNSAAVPFMFSTEPRQELKIILSITSVAIHLGLFVASYNAWNKILYLEKKLAFLEDLDYEDPEKDSRVPIFSDVDYKPDSVLGLIGPLGTGLFLWFCLALALVSINL